MNIQVMTKIEEFTKSYQALIQAMGTLIKSATLCPTVNGEEVKMSLTRKGDLPEWHLVFWNESLQETEVFGLQGYFIGSYRPLTPEEHQSRLSLKYRLGVLIQSSESAEQQDPSSQAVLATLKKEYEKLLMQEAVQYVVREPHEGDEDTKV